jgi:outer membrane lipoprotein carrier protein
VWAVLWTIAVPWLAAGQDLSMILKSVENRYNRAQTIQVLFDQTYTAQGRPQRRESGELFLRKPGRMRWEYSTPPGKLFISDGKQVYLYSPAAKRVERARVKESDDLRAPLGFLLGKLDFWRDFQKFVHRPEGEDLRITAQPNSERAYYQEVEFVVTPARQIRYLKVLGQDHSVMEFHFSNERINVALPETLFRFVPPPGVEVVEAISAGGMR